MRVKLVAATNGIPAGMEIIADEDDEFVLGMLKGGHAVRLEDEIVGGYEALLAKTEDESDGDEDEPETPAKGRR